MNYLYYDDISYAHTKQWECSLNKAEEWANQLYSLYPKVDRAIIGSVVSTALQHQLNDFKQVEELLQNYIKR